MSNLVEYLSGHWFWRDRFLSFVNASLGEVDFSINKWTATPFPKGDNNHIAKKDYKV